MANKQKAFADSIIDKIRNGELVNSAFLPCERSLAAESGFSRVTVRAALQMLVKRKILQTIPNKGYQVVQIPTIPLPDTLNIGAVLCSGTYTEYSYVLYQAAEQKAQKSKYGVFVRFSEDDMKEQAFSISNLLEQKPDGLLVVPTYDESSGRMTLGNHRMLTLLRRAGVPLVMVDRTFPENDLPCVVNNEYSGGQMVADHFSDFGYKSVVFLATDFSYYVTHRRFGGFLKRCKEKKIKAKAFYLPEDRNMNVESRLAVYRKNRDAFFEVIRKNKATAVLVNQPEITESILRDLDEAGLDVVLYDSHLDVSVKCNAWRVERPIDEISAKATEMLLDEIRAGSRGPIRQIRLKPIIKPLPRK